MAGIDDRRRGRSRSRATTSDPAPGWRTRVRLHVDRIGAARPVRGALAPRHPGRRSAPGGRTSSPRPHRLATASTGERARRPRSPRPPAACGSSSASSKPATDHRAGRRPRVPARGHRLLAGASRAPRAPSPTPCRQAIDPALFDPLAAQPRPLRRRRPARGRRRRPVRARRRASRRSRATDGDRLRRRRTSRNGRSPARRLRASSGGFASSRRRRRGRARPAGGGDRRARPAPRRRRRAMSWSRSPHCRPRQVVYVACDPVALARDVALFAGHGYDLAGLRAFDLFPNTHHVEAVARVDAVRSPRLLHPEPPHDPGTMAYTHSGGRRMADAGRDRVGRGGDRVAGPRRRRSTTTSRCGSASRPPSSKRATSSCSPRATVQELVDDLDGREVDVVVLDLSLGDGSSVTDNVKRVQATGSAVLVHSIADRVAQRARGPRRRRGRRHPQVRPRPRR